MNDFSLSVATVNGSGSQSSNIIIVKTLFRMGLPVGAQNLFPSNIAGLPTWFSIRVQPDGFVSRKLFSDIVICKNADTFAQDVRAVRAGGYFFYDSEIKAAAVAGALRADVQNFALPFRNLSQALTESVKMRKFLTNMIYVGVLSELMKFDTAVLKGVVHDQFSNKGNAIAVNESAIEAGAVYAREHLKIEKFAYTVRGVMGANNGQILIDGNSAAGLGAIAGGCTFLSWYPITPSSSLAESMQHYADEFRVSQTEEKDFAVVQAEDELSAINMVIGAGWAGSRAMTATSGPGLSLMAEAAGLSYFAEVPAVIWDVQRAGPSTGLPTRTMQGDVRAAASLSHGDTEHVVLIPANPAECFEFAGVAFDLAEELQTLVIVLSDLDLGMNLSMSPEFKLSTQKYRRGKVLGAQDLIELEAKGQEYARYRDVDGDGIGYRTLPGTPHMKAAFFTRGTGHTEKATYSEDAATFAAQLDRLKKKMQLAIAKLPAPVLSLHGKPVDTLIVAFGSSDAAIAETRAVLAASQDLPTDYLRLRAWPVSASVGTTFKKYKKIFIIEQNRDQQMRGLLTEKFFTEALKFQSVLSYDGLPLSAEFVVREIQRLNSDTKNGGGGHA